jgi:hypothetical protein
VGFRFYRRVKILPAHQEPYSEAQEQTVPDALPKGNKWRGWLWAVLILALLEIAVRLALR